MRASTTVNGKRVERGDTVVTFRGDRLTFDYVHDGRIFTQERPTGLLHRVFVDAEPKARA